jgi:hypothetical protein
MNECKKRESVSLGQLGRSSKSKFGGELETSYFIRSYRLLSLQFCNLYVKFQYPFSGVGKKILENLGSFLSHATFSRTRLGARLWKFG